MIHACGDVDIVPLVGGLARPRDGGPARPRRRTADLLRLDDGGRRHHPAPPAGRQRRPVHPRRPGHRRRRAPGGHHAVGRGGRPLAPRSRRRRGGRRQRADGAVPAARAGRSPAPPRPAAVARPAGRVRRRRRVQGGAGRRSTTASRTSPSTAGAAAARWRPPRSTPWPARRSSSTMTHRHAATGRGPRSLFGVGVGPGDPELMTLRPGASSARAPSWPTSRPATGRATPGRSSSR